MAAFPHTAPVFTEEDLEREFASLTQEQRDNIEKDKLGIQYLEEETDEQRELGLMQMEEELENIPLEEKMDYIEALIKVPDLVERESPMLTFLRKHHCNAADAAQNLIIYWRWRAKLFKDKRFLPMTIKGALQDDFDALSTGFCQILPHDNNGRIVLYHQKSRVNCALHHRDSLCRVVFYIHHVASLDKRAQLNGFVGLQNLRGTKMKDLDRLYSKQAYYITEIAAPIRCCTVHLPSPHLWLFPASLTLPIFRFVTPPSLRVKGHFYECISEVEQYGLSMENIPISMGGKYGFDIFDNWIERQIEKEEAENN